MNYITFSSRSLVIAAKKYCKGETISLFILLVLGTISSKQAVAQIPNCSANVPTYNVNFVGNPGGTFTTPNVTRQGNCCGTSSPDRCIHFSITLDTADVAVNFQITSGAIPPGALFYQVDCGPQTQVGNHICVSGAGVHHLTFCKPGNNTNTYSVTAIPHPLVPVSDTVRVGCSKNITALGYNAASVTWNSIFPGAAGSYNSYLSCTSGCTSPLFTPQVGSPPFIDYVVCGSPTATGCGLALNICDTVRVYVYPALTVTVSPNPASFCPTSPGVTLTASPVGGFGTYHYVWKKAGVTVGNAASYFATTAGTYTVDVIDALTSCPTITVSVPVIIASISLTPSHTDVSCNGGNNGTASVVASGGTLPYTYVWSPNVGSTSSVTGLIAGTYIVTVTDAGGCSQNTSIIVTQPTALVPVITSTTNVVCHGQSTGAIDISVSGGTPPYTYHWSSGQTTQDISGMPAGIYTDTIFDAHGCKATILDSITQPAAIVTLPSSGSINGTDLTCYGSADGMASVTVVGGTLPYTYVWSTGPGDTTASVTGLSAGTISVVITDANGCSANASTVINQPDSITAATVADSVYFGGYNITCHGATNGFASITVNGGTTPYSYLWSNNDTTPNLTNVPAGHYVVTITDAHGCIKLDSIDLTEPDSLVGGVTSPLTAGGYNIACKGQSSGIMDIAIIGGTPPFIIAWSTGDSNVTHLTHLLAGFYSVNITDHNGCTTMDTITLTEPDTLVPLITATLVLGGTNIKCYGGTMDSATVIVTGGSPPFTFFWSPTNDTTQTIYNVYSDTISVLVTDTNGCSGSDDYFVAQPTPVQSTVGSSVYNGGYNVSCFRATDGYAFVIPTGGTPPYSFTWSTAATTDSIHNLAAGNYYVTITDTNGCVKLDSISLSEPDSLVISSLADTFPSGDNIRCHGASDGSINSLVVGGTSPYTFVWSTSPTDTLADISGLSVGSYSVTVTDDNGCTARDSVTLTEPTQLVIDSLYSPVYPGGWNVSCNGGDNGNIYSNASGGSPPYSYSWSNGDTTQNALNVSVFTYIDTVIDLNGCRVRDSITLTEPQPLILTVSSVGPAGCFGAPTGHITVTTTGGTQPYKYSIDGITFSASNTFNNLPAATYIIYVADTNGCADSIMVTISQPTSALSSSISAQTNVNCFGNATGSVTIHTTGGTRPYTFSIGGPFQADSTFSNLLSGLHTVTVRDSNNCTTTVSVTISQPAAALMASIQTQVNVDCYSNASGSVTIATSGGTQPYQYSIGGPFQLSNTFSNLPAAAYVITVKDSNNCTTTVAVNILQPTTPLLATITTLNNVDCHGNATGMLTVNVTGGTPFYQCSFNGSAFAGIFTFTNLTAGVDSIIIRDMNDCRIRIDTVITEPAFSLSASVSSQVNVDCRGSNNGSLTVLGNGGTPSYQYSINGGATFVSNPTFSNLPGGLYVIIIRDLNACTALTSTTILEPSSSLNVSVSSNVPVDCFGNATGSLTASSSGGTAPYTFSIGGGPFGPDSVFANLAAGPHTITIMDAHSCTSSVTASVSQPIGPLVANAGTAFSVCGTSANLGAVLNPGANGTWSVVTGTGVFADSHLDTTAVSGLSVGNNTFQWDVSSGNCHASAQVTVTQDAVIRADGGGDADTCYNESTHFVLHATPPGSANGFWTVITPSSGTLENPGSATTNFTPSVAPSVSHVIWTVINGTCTDRDTIMLNYLKGGDCFNELDLPSAFSPNSDSHNDAYVIHGIELYPENKFIVFNRWGNEVYSKDNYRNYGSDDADWKGQNKSEEKLPDGTYFVVLTIPKSDIVRTTYVDIRR